MVYLQPDEMNQDIKREKFTFTMGANSSNPEASSFDEQVRFTNGYIFHQFKLHSYLDFSTFDGLK